eukprot:TRINITY_DN7799_c0_g1::TRINITY_DN7799_c0_g1_i1::g.8336::m.8336 TRINITY_DN7799_c0_g1::TRINITY_DN7799_c0_g1_i1::g.8336  ORF type:complete len:170 (+),score=20.84,MCPsignal/PF00015.16/0.037 TRINITY_DN7799_c0_g1_i1:1-510(+)
MSNRPASGKVIMGEDSEGDSDDDFQSPPPISSVHGKIIVGEDNENDTDDEGNKVIEPVEHTPSIATGTPETPSIVAPVAESLTEKRHREKREAIIKAWGTRAAQIMNGVQMQVKTTALALSRTMDCMQDVSMNVAHVNTHLENILVGLDGTVRNHARYPPPASRTSLVR